MFLQLMNQEGQPLHLMMRQRSQSEEEMGELLQAQEKKVDSPLEIVGQLALD